MKRFLRGKTWFIMTITAACLAVAFFISLSGHGHVLGPSAAQADSGGSDGSCFVAGTPVLMADGSTKPIELVAVGDVVRIVDELDGGLTTSVVAETIHHPSRQYDIYTLVFDNGDAVQVTGEHSIFESTTGEYQTVFQLVDLFSQAQSVRVRLANGSSVRLTGVAVEARTIPVYNLHVVGLDSTVGHNYFAGGILVHNSGEGKCPTGTKECAPPPPGCFVAGTPVLMADGSTKPIEQVQIGERIVIFDDATGQPASSPVVQTLHHLQREYDIYTLQLTNGDKLEVTGEHSLFEVTTGSYQTVAALANRFSQSLPVSLQLASGQAVGVIGVSVESLEIPVYNLHVAGLGQENGHNYYANGVLAHNSGEGKKPICCSNGIVCCNGQCCAGSQYSCIGGQCVKDCAARGLPVDCGDGNCCPASTTCCGNVCCNQATGSVPAEQCKSVSIPTQGTVWWCQLPADSCPPKEDSTLTQECTAGGRLVPGGIKRICCKPQPQQTCGVSEVGPVGTDIPVCLNAGCTTGSSDYCGDDKDGKPFCCASNEKCWNDPADGSIAKCSKETCPAGQEACGGTGNFAGFNKCCAAGKCRVQGSGYPECI